MAQKHTPSQTASTDSEWEFLPIEKHEEAAENMQVPAETSPTLFEKLKKFFL